MPITIYIFIIINIIYMLSQVYSQCYAGLPSAILWFPLFHCTQVLCLLHLGLSVVEVVHLHLLYTRDDAYHTTYNATLRYNATAYNISYYNNARARCYLALCYVTCNNASFHYALPFTTVNVYDHLHTCSQVQVSDWRKMVFLFRQTSGNLAFVKVYDRFHDRYLMECSGIVGGSLSMMLYILILDIFLHFLFCPTIYTIYLPYSLKVSYIHIQYTYYFYQYTYLLTIQSNSFIHFYGYIY